MLALWVTIGHYEAFPLFAGVNEATPVGRFLVHAWQSIVFGTPAVIVFFVISGFCIHLPFAVTRNSMSENITCGDTRGS